jgi:hypothetical protein
VNGNPTLLSAVDATLETLRPAAKVLFYYRENAKIEPTDTQLAEVQKLLNAMMRLRLPISLSSKPDFSDSVDASGVSHPRPSSPQV